MTFKTSVEIENTGLLTFEQTPNKITFENNQLELIGDILVLGTISATFLNDIFDVKNVQGININADTLTTKKLVAGNLLIAENNISMTGTLTGEKVTSTTVTTPTTAFTALGQLTTNKLNTGFLTATSIQSNVINIDALKNVSGLVNLSVSELLTSGNIKLSLSEILSSSIKTKNLSADSITSQSITKLTEFKNVTSKLITATKFTAPKFILQAGKISASTITLNTLSGQALSSFTNFPSLQTKTLNTESIESVTFNTSAISGANVIISGNNISSIGLVTTESVITGTLTTPLLLKPTGTLTIESIGNVNGVIFDTDLITFKTINTLETVTGSTTNISADTSEMNISSVNITGDTTIEKLIPTKIIVNEINADTINSTTVSAILNTNTAVSKDIILSGAMEIDNIYSSRTLNIQSNVDIETTTFINGDVNTGSLITCRLITTPLIAGVTNITSTEHNFEESLINGVTFDDDGVVTSGQYNVPSVHTDEIHVQTVDKSVVINGSVTLASSEVICNNLNSSTTTAGNVSNTSTTSTDADILSIITDSITVTEPLGTTLINNKINSNSLKTFSITAQQDVFATQLVSALDQSYIYQVHVVTNAPVTLSGISGTVNGVKLVPDLIVLVNNQANNITNGIYKVSENAWTRYKLLTTTSATNATITTAAGDILTNTQSPSIVDTDPILFVVTAPSTVLNDTIVNDATTLNTGNVVTTQNVTSDTFTATKANLGSLNLVSGFIDITTEASINGMLTTSDHLQNVSNVTVQSIVATNVSVTDLNVPDIKGSAIFGGVTFDNHSLTFEDLSAEELSLASIQSETISTFNISDVTLNNNTLKNEKLTTDEVNVNTFGVNLVSFTGPTGTYDLKFPDEYSAVTQKTALTRTATNDNEWSIIPDAKSVGVSGSIQYMSNGKLHNTSDLILKPTATLKINISNASNTLSNHVHSFTDGTYPYDDEIVSFYITVTSGIATLSDPVVLNSNIYDIFMEIPISHNVIQTREIKVNDVTLSGNSVSTSVGDLLVSTPTDIVIVPKLVNKNTRIGFDNTFNSVTNGTVTVSADGSFVAVDEPTLDTHPVTKNYTDTNLQTFNWTESADFVHVQNVTNYSNGIFSPINVAFFDGTSIDSVADGIKILLVNQSDKLQNGLYVLSASKTVLTRILTGEVAGTSTHVKNGTLNTDAVYVCTGTNVTAGTDPCIYTKIIDGQYEYGTSIINDGEINLSDELSLLSEKITATDIPYTKLSDTGFGLRSSTSIHTALLGSSVSTIINVSTDKSELNVNETYTGHKTFSGIVTNNISTGSVFTTGTVVAGALPFISENNVTLSNINSVTDLDNFDTSNVYTQNVIIGDLSVEFSLLLNQNTPDENGYYNYTEKANIQTPYMVNDRYKINLSSVQDNILTTLTSDSIIVPIVTSSILQTDAIFSDVLTNINNTEITANDISAETLYTENITFNDITTITASVTTTGNIILSGSGTYAPETTILVQFQTAKIENGAYLTKSGDWVKLSSKFVLINGTTFQISNSGTVTPFAKKEYEFTGVTNISNSYTADYYSDVQFELVGTFVDGHRVQANDTVLVVNDGIYSVGISNWLKTNTFQDTEICAIQKGNKYAGISFKKINGETLLNYDHVVQYVSHVNTAIGSTSYPENAKVLLTAQTNEPENGIYTVVNSILTGQEVLTTTQQIVSTENESNTIIMTNGVTFYSDPSETVFYYLQPQKPLQFDTYTDGTSIYLYTDLSVWEKVRDISESEYIYISKIQKVLHNNTFVPVIEKILPSVSIGSVKFKSSMIENIGTVSGLPSDNVSIEAEKIGTYSLSGLSLQSDVVTLSADTSILHGSLTTNDITVNNTTLSNLNIQSITFDDLHVNSDISIGNTKIKQKGLKVSAVITATSIPSGLLQNIKHDQVVLILDTLGPFIAKENGKWVKLLSPEEPYIFGSVQYNTVENVLESSPYLETLTDIHTSETISSGLITTGEVTTSNITIDSFVSDVIDIQVQKTSIGMKYIKVVTHYTPSLTIVNLDPLSNATDTTLRGTLNNARLYPGANVLLIGDGMYTVYSTSPAVLVANPEQYSFHDTTNNKYFNYLHVEIFPTENVIISGNNITAFTYITDNHILTDTPGSSLLFPNTNVEIGSSSTAIISKPLNTKSLTTGNITANNISTNKFTGSDITIEGNISSLNTLKFNESPSMNSVELASVNNLNLLQDLTCDSMVTSSITHGGFLDIHSIVADTVIENTSLTNKNLITVPVFNSYEFVGFNVHSNVSRVFDTVPTLSGVPSGLTDNDTVIVSEPRDTGITSVSLTISNPTITNIVTLPESINIEHFTVNTAGFGGVFRQLTNLTVAVYIIDTTNNQHGFQETGKIGINVPIDITLSGYRYPIENGVYTISSGAWQRVTPDTTGILSLDTQYHYKSVDETIVIRLPYLLKSIPTVSHPNSTITVLTEDTLIVDLNTGYTDQYTKVPETGTFTLKDTNKKATLKNIFVRADDIYVQSEFEITKRTWLRTDYVSSQNILIPTITNIQDISIGTDILTNGETVLLTSQTNNKENGLYVLQNDVLIRPSGFNEEIIMDEFVWDSNEGFGYYVYGTVGNFLIIQKTETTHPHASESIILDSLTTSSIVSNLSTTKVFQGASNIMLEIGEWNCNNFNTDAITITVPNVRFTNSLVSDVIKMSSNIIVDQNIQSNGKLKLTGTTVNIGSAEISLNNVSLQQLSVDTVTANILGTDSITTSENIVLPDFIIGNNSLTSNSLIVKNTLDIPTVVTSILNTAKVITSEISAPGTIKFVNDSITAMTITGSSIDIPRMTLPNVVSSVIGRTNTSIFTDVSGHLNAFTKASEINLNTVTKIVGSSSSIKLKGSANIRGNSVNINRSMTNRTPELEIHGNLNLNKITASKNLSLAGDIVLGTDLFSISNKLNKINLTTPLHLESFLGNSKELQVGNRNITNVLSIAGSSTVSMRAREININYLKDVPSFDWQPYVNVICEYPLDILEPVYIINGKEITVGMEILLTANGQDNAVYTIITGNFLSRVKELSLSQAYTSPNVKSVYLTGDVLVNARPEEIVSSVDSYSNNWDIDSYVTYTTTNMVNAPVVTVSFLLKFTSTSLYGLPGIYSSNGCNIHYNATTQSFIAAFEHINNAVEIAIPGGVQANETYNIKVEFNMAEKYVTLSLDGVQADQQTDNYKDILTHVFPPFINEYTIGFNERFSTGTPYAALRVARITDFTVSVPSPASVSTSKTFMIKDITHNSSVKQILQINFLSNISIFTFKCNIFVLEDGTPTLVSSNGNRIYYNRDTGFYMDFLILDTVYHVTSHVPIVIEPNTIYDVSAQVDYHTMELTFTINGISGTTTTDKPSNYITLFRPLMTETILGDIYPFTETDKKFTQGELTNFEIHTPGYAPTVPRIYKVSDKLRIIGSYKHETDLSESYDVQVNTTLLDKRSKITIDSTKYTIYPSVTVTSTSSFRVTPYGTDGAAISGLDEIKYTIENFDYSRIDNVYLDSNEQTRSFMFTSEQYLFDVKLEHVLFKFVGKPGLIFSGELLDSHDTIRKEGYTGYNTWIIDITRTDPTDTVKYSSFGLEYYFVTEKYPFVQATFLNPLPVKTIKYNESDGLYKQSSYTGTDHIKETYTTQEQKHDFGYDSITYVTFSIESGEILTDGAPQLDTTILEDNSLFKLVRIPNTYGLKNGVYNTEHPSDSTDIRNNTSYDVIPSSIFSTYFYYHTSHSVNSDENRRNITVGHNEKYRIVTIVSYPENGDSFVYFAHISADGNLVTPATTEMDNPIKFAYYSHYSSQSGTPNTHGATIQVYDDYIFIATDKTDIVSYIEIPVKNQPEFTFVNKILNITTTATGIQAFDNQNAQLENISLLYKNMSGSDIYRIPNTANYTAGMYGSYKTNSSQGSKRIFNMKNLKRTLSKRSDGLLVAYVSTGNSPIVEDIEITTTATTEQRFIFSVVTRANTLEILAFPENGVYASSNLEVEISLRLCKIEVNFDVSSEGNFSFEIPVDMPNNSWQFRGWKLGTLTIPGGKGYVVSLNGNVLSGTITKIGTELHQGTYYDDLSTRYHPNVRGTSVHITSQYIYVTIQDDIPANVNIQIPVFEGTVKDQNETTTTTITTGVAPVISKTNILLYPSTDSSPLNGEAIADYQMAYIEQTSEFDPVMELLAGSVVMKPSDPIGYKRTIKINDDILANGSYDLSHDINTQQLAFIPERTYTSSGPANALFRYKIEVNKNKELVVEKKALQNNTVSLADNESFRLSIYLVGKPTKIAPLKIFNSNARTIVNIPKKEYATTLPSFITDISINMGFTYNTTVVKLPIHFNGNVLVKFENISGVTFNCSKISSNLFIVSASTLLTPLQTRLTFQALFLETATATTTTVSKSIEYVQSVVDTYTQDTAQSLLDFVSVHDQTFASINTVPYPATSTTDAFNIDLNPLSLLPTGFIHPVSDINLLSGKVIAVKTTLTNEPVYTFRFFVQSSGTLTQTTTSLDISRYPLILPGWHYYAEKIGPLIDNSYTHRNSTEYAYQVNVQDQTLNLTVTTLNNQQWSNITYWDVTVYRDIPAYSDHVNTSTIS